MKRYLNNLLGVCLVILPMVVSWPLTGWADEWLPMPGPLTYSAEAIEAWVVDEDTGQPLEGVIVVAHWQLYGGLHRSHVGQMMVMETITDANGRFFFPAWGPKLRPLEGYLDKWDPQLLFFKPDYEFRVVENKPREEVNTSSLRRSEWNGQIIKLKKFQGSIEQYAQHIGDLDGELDFAFDDNDCWWKQTPRMLIAMHMENKRFKEQGLRASSYYPSSLKDRDEEFSPTQVAKCGSLQEFLRSYLP